MPKQSKSLNGQQHQGGSPGFVSYKKFKNSPDKKREKLLASEKIQKGKEEKKRRMAASAVL